MIKVQCVGRRRLDIYDEGENFKVEIRLGRREALIATLVIPRAEFEKIYSLQPTSQH